MSGAEPRWTGLKPGERPYRESAEFYADYRYRPTEAFMRLLASHLEWSSADRVLDLGAGPAHISIPVAAFVGEVVVLDPEEPMLAVGKRRGAAAGLDNLSFVVGGSDDLPRLSATLGTFATAVISQALAKAILPSYSTPPDCGRSRRRLTRSGSSIRASKNGGTR